MRITPAIIAFLFIWMFPFGAIAFEAQRFPQAFFVEGTDIEVSQKELGSEGPYPVNGARILVKRENKIVLDETMELQGELSGAWVTDMDRDKNPEVTLWVRQHGSGGYGDFSLYEIKGSKLSARSFPPLTESQNKGYAGHDQLTTSPSNIVRRFKTYKSNDPNCCPTGPTVELIYSYDGKQITLQRFRKMK